MGLGIWRRKDHGGDSVFKEGGERLVIGVDRVMWEKTISGRIRQLSDGCSKMLILQYWVERQWRACGRYSV